ncbi:restriction endonuclease [Magnetospirillum sp. 15-1]|uniref:restriction endonuclease n=1 Tax=Magnetospirillum sp. 15-1 TaxID=1979370 RepID=UPI000BBBD672|nr:restriction endonuclease [Magnetospirillum sp. 15-1]
MGAGDAFEDYVHFVYSTILNLKGENIQVSRRTVFKLPSGETYEVDVYYEFIHAGFRHRVAIECKDWKAPVDQGRVLEFHQKIKNIGQEVVGVFISRSGYQSGAHLVASRLGVLLLTADKIPSLNDLLISHITTNFIPQGHCIGEPFWYIAELSENTMEGTGTMYALPKGSPVEIPLFISKRHAEAFWDTLPDKHLFGVFGLTQYKLRGLLALTIGGNARFGIILDRPRGGDIRIKPITTSDLVADYLLLALPDRFSC